MTRHSLVGARVAWLVPRPTEGSSWNRTVWSHIQALAGSGAEQHVYVIGPDPERTGQPDEHLRSTVERLYGPVSATIRSGLDIEGPYDLAIATVWWTAAALAAQPLACPKAYFVQDRESLFAPMGDGHLLAERSYRLGLAPITIGRWLSATMQGEFGTPSRFLEFTADLEVFHDRGGPREAAVCFLYQPDKAWRGPALGRSALRVLKERRPDVAVYTYGSTEPPGFPFPHEHLGLLTRDDRSELYNRCAVGLSVSATNPSRVPFESMAAGLPVVEIHGPNTVYDLPEDGTILAEPDPTALAAALLSVVEDPAGQEQLRRGGAAFMQRRPASLEFEQFTGIVEEILSGTPVRHLNLQPMYLRAPVAAVDPLSGRGSDDGSSTPTAGSPVPPPDDTIDEFVSLLQTRKDTWKSLSAAGHRAVSPLGRYVRRMPLVRRPFLANDRLLVALSSLDRDLDVYLRHLTDRDLTIAGLRSRVAALEDQIDRQRSQRSVGDELSLMAANIAGMAIRSEEGLRSLRLALASDATGSASRELYLDLLESALTGGLWEDRSFDPWGDGTFASRRRAVGRDWPASALTMIGTARMRSLRSQVQQVLEDGIPGDLVETGVWRGGACIYMRGILAAWGERTRRVFVADSFRGLPEPDAGHYPEDEGSALHTYGDLAIPRDAVEGNFRRFGLLDDQVVFLEGWFKDTLPTAAIDRLAILRLDGDMYESTTDALEALYERVSPGGFVIVDDYNLWPCRRAVDDFRSRMGITAPLQEIDGSGVWWRPE